jgi:glutathione S-transferase
MIYELYYWPTIQGRGELVRLALEEAGAEYVDVARQPQGVAALMRLMRGEEGSEGGIPPFAPPFLRVRGEDAIIAQTAAILRFLGPRLGLSPKGEDAETARALVDQLQLTVSDAIAEAHEVHHPIAASLYYEDQKVEAKRRAKHFVAERIPKYLDYFARVLGDKEWLTGALTYADLSLFQLLAGLSYAFPRATAKAPASLVRLHDRVKARPRIAAYLASARRLPFNEQGIFRHYPELDEG